MEKKEFLEIVKGFSRKDFKDYMYREINKKRKLIDVISGNLVKNTNKK